MSNLIEELGYNRFRQKFGGSFFYDDDNVPSQVVSLAENELGVIQVRCTSVSGPVSAIRVSDKVLPAAFFTGLATFKTPKLGWRSGYGGKLLAYLERDNRSYHRGISPNNLRVNWSPMSQWLMRTSNFNFNLTSNKLCALALTPTFVPFAEGIEAMRRGDMLSFAASPEVAVVPGEEGRLNIMFRQKVGGFVMADGTIEATTSIINDYIKDMQ